MDNLTLIAIVYFGGTAIAIFIAYFFIIKRERSKISSKK